MEATAKKAQIEKFSLISGDVIITKDSESSDDIAIPAFVPESLPGVLCGYHLAIFRPSQSVVLGAFLNQLLQLKEIRHYFFTLANGVTRYGLTAGALKSAKLLTPPLIEQSVIAEILGACDEAIEFQEQLIAQKQQRKKSLMQKLLNGTTRFSEFSDVPWVEQTLGSLLKHVFRPIDWSPDLKLRLVSIRRRSGGLFFRPELIGSEYKTSDLHEIREDDFLISKRQVTHGALSVVGKEFEGGHVSKEYTIFENINSQKLHMPFLGWLCRTREMWHMAYVASNGVAIEKLIFVPKDFLKFEISLPPTIEEQKKIADVLNACESEIDESVKKLEQLKQQKKGLMQQLLTGKVRVKL